MKDRKQAYHPKFDLVDLVEHKFIAEVKCILIIKQTKQIGK
jgi:hypothetical protein